MEEGLEEPGPLFSQAQQRFLQILTLLTAPLSVIGSGIILYYLYIDRKRQRSLVFSRIVAGLSIYDIIFSCRFLFLGSWVVPKGTDFVYGATGSITTCNISGFVGTLGLGISFYTASMAVYFLLLIRFGVREKTIAKKVEPLFHIVANAVPLAIAIYALSKEYMNPIDSWPGQCWLQDNPPGCSSQEDVECIRGEDYKLFSRIVGSGLVMLVWTTVIVAMVAIYLQVRATEIRLRSYSVEGDARLKRTRQTGWKALSYIAAYLVCYGPLVVMQLCTADATEENRTLYFTLAFLSGFFTPLQGVFNACIFLKARYQTLVDEDSPVVQAIETFRANILNPISTAGSESIRTLLNPIAAGTESIRTIISPISLGFAGVIGERQAVAPGSSPIEGATSPPPSTANGPKQSPRRSTQVVSVVPEEDEEIECGSPPPNKEATAELTLTSACDSVSGEGSGTEDSQQYFLEDP